MKRRTNSARLHQLRTEKGWSFTKFADESGVDRQTIFRLEKGRLKSLPQPRTVDALAKALGVTPADLCGGGGPPASEPPVQADPGPEDGTLIQLNVRIDSSIKNAFSLVARSYRVSEADIVRLAPLLFTLVAEGSLARRKAVVAEMDELLGSQLGLLPHFPRSVVYPSGAEDALKVERESIAARDVFAEQIDRRPEYDHETWARDYAPETHNPFVGFLQNACRPFSELAEINSFHRGSADYTVQCKTAIDLAGGDEALAHKLLDGTVLINEIPKELLARDREQDRLAWLRERVEQVEQETREFLESL